MKLKQTVFLMAVVVALGLLLGAASPASAANNYFYTNGESCVGKVTDLDPPLEGLLSEKSSFSFVYGTFNELFGPFDDPDLDVPPGDEGYAINLLEETAEFYLVGGAGRDCIGPEGFPSGRFLIPWDVFTVDAGQKVNVKQMQWKVDDWQRENQEPVSADDAFWWIQYTERAEGNQAPVADAGGPYEGVTGTAVQFDGSASFDPDGSSLTYLWEFGDGDTSDEMSPSKTYADAGVYNVTLTVTDDSGDSNTNTASQTTTVDIRQASLPPVADAGGPYIGIDDAPVTFSGAGSTDPDGTIVEWSWDFGDGSEPGSGEETTHTYSDPGSYDVTLTVRDNLGETAFDSTKALIGEDSGNQAPTADAGGPYRSSIGAGTTISFDGTASSDPDGDIARYVWDFGDGTRLPGGGATPTHTYSADGIYYVTLQVRDDDRAWASDATVAIVGIAQADAGGPYAGTPGAPVQFDGSNSTGGVVEYDWNFGDGSAGGSGATPTHTYAEQGINKVTLSVTDINGDTDSDSTVAVIGDGNLAPVADAGGPYEGEVGVPVSFNGSNSMDPDGEIVGRVWSFGDSTSIQDVETTTHTYDEPGLYNVTHAVTDDSGATDADSTTVRISSPLLCECDLNTDGICDELDWELFLAGWGRTDCNEDGVEPCECDLNDDGSCDFSDFLLFFSDWVRDTCRVPEE